jgi:SAM-dependent methyltransferase
MDARDWDRRYTGPELLWGAGPNRFVVEELQDLPPGRALDLAAGEGRNAIWLAERGWTVQAIDFSPVALERGRRLAAERGVQVDFVEADLNRLVPEPEAHELVLVGYLHLPWEQLGPILGRAAAAVAPGGTFLCVGHDRSNLQAGHGGPQDAAVLYGPDQVAGALPGLIVERAEVVRRPVQTDGGPRVALDNLVRAHRPR